MAKGRIVIPPRRNIGKTVKAIVNRGPIKSPQPIMAKGKTQNKVQQIQQSRIPTPSQNQRGRIRSKDERDLTR
jgi:hypothetical protein